MSENESGSKDLWDKIEILGKVCGAVLVPVVAGAAIYLWNSDRTSQQTAASVTPLAVDILKGASAPDDAVALREWVVSVLNDPTNPPPLTNEAASTFSSLELPKLPPSLQEPCRNPSEFLEVDGNWEIMLGRVGDELQYCEAKRRIVLDAYNDIARILAE